MSDQYDAYDRDLLNEIEKIIANPADKAQEPSSIHGFSARLASTVPQASDNFRNNLLARLQRELAQAAQSEQPATRPIGLRPTATPQEYRAPAVKPARLPATTKPVIEGLWARRRRRFAAIATGLVGAMLMLALFVGMASLLRTRQQASHPNGMPTITPVDTLAQVPSMAIIGTLNAGPARYMAWSPDGRTLATAEIIKSEYEDGVIGAKPPTETYKLDLWDSATDNLISSVSMINVKTLVWSPDGNILAVGLDKNTIKLLGNDGQELYTLSTPMPGERQATEGGITWGGETFGNAGWVTGIAWSPDGRALATASGEPFTINPVSSDGVIRVWDPASGQLTRSLNLPAEKSSPPPGVTNVAVIPTWTNDVTWSPDGRMLASTVAGAIMMWDAATGQLRYVFKNNGTEDTYARYTAWSPDGRTLAFIVGRSVALVNAASGSWERSLPEGLPPSPLPTALPQVPISPQPYETPTPVNPYDSYNELYFLEWSPNGQALATADLLVIRVWDPTTGGQLQAMPANVGKLAWSPDGHVLTSLGEHGPLGQTGNMQAGTVRLWNPATGKQLRTLMDGKAYNFAWSPDGRTLAISAESGIALWGAFNSSPFATGTVEASTSTALTSSTPTEASKPTPLTSPTPPLGCAPWTGMALPGPRSPARIYKRGSEDSMVFEVTSIASEPSLPSLARTSGR